jgi:hypothetical protein
MKVRVSLPCASVVTLYRVITILLAFVQFIQPPPYFKFPACGGITPPIVAVADGVWAEALLGAERTATQAMATTS